MGFLMPYAQVCSFYFVVNGKDRRTGQGCVDCTAPSNSISMKQGRGEATGAFRKGIEGLMGEEKMKCSPRALAGPPTSSN